MIAIRNGRRPEYAPFLDKWSSEPRPGVYQSGPAGAIDMSAARPYLVSTVIRRRCTNSAVCTEIIDTSDYNQPRIPTGMRMLVWLETWLETAENALKYSSFIRVAGMRVPGKIKRLFYRAAAGKISHDDLRAEYMQQRGLRRE